MSTSIKIKLDQLYEVAAASEPAPAHYTPATVEIVSASSAVTIRATTKSDFEGGYADLPTVVDDAAEGEVYQCDLTRSVRYVSFSCSDSSAEIYVAGFKLTEKEEPVEPEEPEEPAEPEEPSDNEGE